MFKRKIFFDHVRVDPFDGKLDQKQVAGMEAILTAWEAAPPSNDLRHLAYPLATTKHETSHTMQPIEEYGRGKTMSYGQPDSRTGQTYYGRGYVQLTWPENYIKADDKLGLKGDKSCYLHPENALKPGLAATIMFRGMMEGWFRKDHHLRRYFSSTVDDAFNAREIINGDKHRIPPWGGGKKIGVIIAAEHVAFFNALKAAYSAPAIIADVLPVETPLVVTIRVSAPAGVRVDVVVDET